MVLELDAGIWANQNCERDGQLGQCSDVTVALKAMLELLRGIAPVGRGTIGRRF